MRKFLLGVFLLLAVGLTYSEAGKPLFYATSESVTVTNSNFANTTDDIGELSTGNLTVGRTYKISGGYEDFTGYNETDDPTKVTVGANVITLTAGDRDENYYVTKSFGAGYFTDFTQWVDVNVTALTNDAISAFPCWAISNADDDLKDIDDANGDSIFIYVLRITTDTHYSFIIQNCDGGVATTSSGIVAVAVNTPSYLSITRSSTTMTVQVYSTAALRIAGGAGDVETITLTVVNTAFRYVYGLGSFNNGLTDKDISGTISNLALKQFVDDGSTSQSVNTYFTATSATITLDSTYKVFPVTIDSWTSGTGWNPDTAMTGKAQATAGTASDLEIDVSASAGTYTLTYTTAGATTGTLTPQIGGVNGTVVTTENTTNTVRITATGTGNLKFQKSATWDGTVDAITLTKTRGPVQMFNWRGNR